MDFHKIVCQKWVKLMFSSFTSIYIETCFWLALLEYKKNGKAQALSNNYDKRKNIVLLEELRLFENENLESPSDVKVCDPFSSTINHFSIGMTYNLFSCSSTNFSYNILLVLLITFLKKYLIMLNGIIMHLFMNQKKSWGWHCRECHLQLLFITK